MGPERARSSTLSAQSTTWRFSTLGRQGQDCDVVQNIIKETAQSQPLTAVENAPAFKVVVLNDADRLSKDAQHGLRRTMERYQQTCRIFLVAENAAYLIELLRSRCLIVRVPRLGDEHAPDAARGGRRRVPPSCGRDGGGAGRGPGVGQRAHGDCGASGGCRGRGRAAGLAGVPRPELCGLDRPRRVFCTGGPCRASAGSTRCCRSAACPPDEVFCRIAEGPRCGFTGARSSASTSSGRPAGTSSRAGRATRRSSTRGLALRVPARRLGRTRRAAGAGVPEEAAKAPE